MTFARFSPSWFLLLCLVLWGGDVMGKPGPPPTNIQIANIDTSLTDSGYCLTQYSFGDNPIVLSFKESIVSGSLTPTQINLHVAGTAAWGSDFDSLFVYVSTTYGDISGSSLAAIITSADIVSGSPQTVMKPLTGTPTLDGFDPLFYMVTVKMNRTAQGGKWLAIGGFQTLTGKDSTVTYTSHVNTNGYHVALDSFRLDSMPIVSPIYGDSVLCGIGATATLGDSTAGGVWASSDLYAVNLLGSGIIQSMSVPAAAIIYYSVTNGACIANQSKSVSVVNDYLPPSTIGTSYILSSTICYSSASDYIGEYYEDYSYDYRDGIYGVYSATNYLIELSTDGRGYITGITGVGADTVICTYFNGCYTVSDSLVVTIVGPPSVAEITGITGSWMCSATTFNDSTAGGFWYVRQSTDITIDPISGYAQPTISAVNGDHAKIVYIVSNACGIDSVSENVNIGFGVFNAGTIAGYPQTSPICPPTTPGSEYYYISGLGSVYSGAGYSSSFSSSDTSAIKISASGVVLGHPSRGDSAEIYFTITNLACGSYWVDSQRVVVQHNTNAGTIVSATGAHNFCVGDTILLHSIGKYFGSNSPFWFPSFDSIANISPIGVTRDSVMVYFTSAGSTDINLVISDPCSSSPHNTSYHVTVFPGPPSLGIVSIFPAGDSILCVGDTLIVLDTPTGGTWSSSSNSIAQVFPNGRVIGMGAGLASISYSASNVCGVSSTVSLPITVSAVPSGAPITGPTSLCIDSSITYYDDSIGGHWYSSAPTIATIDSISGLVNVLDSGITIISYVLSNSCGSWHNTKAVTVNGSPAPSSVDSIKLCLGTEFSKRVRPGGYWTLSPGLISVFVSTTGDSAVFQTVDTGMQTLVYSNYFDCGGTNTQSYFIHVSDTGHAFPSLLADSNITICASVTDTLVSVTGNGFWFSTQPSTLQVDSLGVITPVGTISQIDTATIVFLQPTSCLYSTVAVTINPLPSVGHLGIYNSKFNAGKIFCDSALTPSIVFPPAANTQYQWTCSNTGFGLSLPSGIDSLPSFITYNAGNDTGSFVITNTPIYFSNGKTCTGATVTDSVKIFPKARTRLISDTVLCNRDSVTYFVSDTTTPATSYTFLLIETDTVAHYWHQYGSGYVTFRANNDSTVPESFRFTVLPKINSTCIGSIDTVVVTVQPTPKIYNQLTGEWFCDSSTVTLVSDTGGGHAPVAYQWSFNPPSAVYAFAYSDLGTQFNVVDSDSSKNLPFAITLTSTIGGCRGDSIVLQDTIVARPQNAVRGVSLCSGTWGSTIFLQTLGTYIDTGLLGCTYSWHLSAPDLIGLNSTDTLNIDSFQALNTSRFVDTDVVSINASVGLCYYTIATTIFKAVPIPVIPSFKDAICNDGAIAAFLPSAASAVAAPTQATWHISQNHGANLSVPLAALNSNTSDSFPTLSPIISSDNTVDTIFISINDSANGCGYALTDTVLVIPTPQVGAVTNRFYNNGQTADSISISGPTDSINTYFNWTNFHPLNTLGFSGSGTDTSHGGPFKLGSFMVKNDSLADIVDTIIITPYIGTCPGIPAYLVDTLGHILYNTAHSMVPDVVCDSTTSSKYYSVQVAGDSLTYTWRVGADSVRAGSVCPFTFVNAGTFPDTVHVMVRPYLHFASDSTPCLPDSFLICVEPRPVVAALNDLQICGGSPQAAIQFQPPDTIVHVMWSQVGGVGIGADTMGTDSIPSFQSVQITGFGTATARYEYHGYINTAAKTCVDSAVQTFKITVRPQLTLEPVSGKTICSGDSIVHDLICTSRGVGTFLNYGWRRDTVQGISPTPINGYSNTISERLYNSDTGQHYVKYNYSLNDDVCFATGSVTDTLNPVPVLIGSLDTVVCSGVPVSVNFLSYTSGCVVSWSADTSVGILGTGMVGTGAYRTTVLSNGNTFTSTIVFIDTIYYRPSFAAHNPNFPSCYSIGFDSLTIRPVPKLAVNSLPPVCSGDGVDFSATSNTNDSPSHIGFSWAVQGYPHSKLYSGTGSGIAISTGDTSVVLGFVSSNGYALVDTLQINFTITDTATAANVCHSSDEIDIIVNPKPSKPTISLLKLPSGDTISMSGTAVENAASGVIYAGRQYCNFVASAAGDTSSIKYKWGATSGVSIGDTTLNLLNSTHFLSTHAVASFDSVGTRALWVLARSEFGSGCAVSDTAYFEVTGTTGSPVSQPLPLLFKEAPKYAFYSIICFDTVVDYEYLWGYDDKNTLTPHLLYNRKSPPLDTQRNQELVLGDSTINENGEAITIDDTATYRFWVQTTWKSDFNGVPATLYQKAYFNGEALQHRGTPSPASSGRIALSVFPDPVSDKLNVKINDDVVQGHQLSVVDAAGRQVSATGGSASLFQFDVASWTSGVYYLKVVGADGSSISVKFIKK